MNHDTDCPISLIPIHENDAVLAQFKESSLQGCPLCTFVYACAYTFYDIWSSWPVDGDPIHVYISNVLENRDFSFTLYIPGGGQTLRLESFITNEERKKEFPFILTVKPHIQPDPRNCFPLIGQWVEDCKTTHENCSSVPHPLLPHRVVVIDVMDKHGAKIIRLHVSQKERAPYIALSHCWGKHVPITTKIGTLEDRMKGLSWNALSQTFQDVIEIAAALGIKYIWIDSLCIIQDDATDWAVESAKMSEIYANATITVAATAALDRTVGCFLPRPSRQLSRQVSFNLDNQESEKHTYKAFVREVTDHTDFTEFTSPSESRSPLFKRAWCFQERLLATRVLHFTTNEVVLECNTTTRYEGDSRPHSTSSLKTEFSELLRMTNDTNDASEEWLSLVERYTCRLLTKHEDILPALSGIAAVISQLGFGRYFAGIWENDLLFWLMWRSIDSQQCHRPPSGVYTAPSFTWASRFGEVRWDIYTRDLRAHMVEITHANCIVQAESPFGRVQSGILRVLGPLVAATLVKHQTPKESNRPSIFGILFKSGLLRPAYIDTTEDGATYLGQTVYCLGLCNLVYEDWENDREISWEYFLVLASLNRDEYTRIGISQSRQSVFRDATRVELSII